MMSDDDCAAEVTPTASILKPRVQLGDEVASYLRDLIMSGQLKGGERIRLDLMAEQLGVSPTPVREALLSLRAEGFVELEPRKGFAVVPISPADVLDVFAAQAILAGELAARACRHMDAATLGRLHAHQRMLEEAATVSDFDALEAENHHFHRYINRAATSPKLAWLLGVLARYSPRKFYATIDGWPKASLEDHEEILLALEHGDEERARQAMHMHIVHAGDLLVAHLETASRGGP